MRKTSFMALVIALVMLLGISTTAMAEVEKSASADLSLMSNYVWRGQKLSESWVVQPSISFGYANFSANLWANYDGDTGELTETDYTLSYTYSFDRVSVEGGYIYYALDSVEDTQELYVGATVDVLLQPSLTLYIDIEEENGGFLVASMGHTFSLPNDMSVDLGASASLNLDNKIMGAGEDGDEFTGLYNGELSAALNIPVKEDITITPMLAYSFPLSDDAEFAIGNASFDGDDNIFYGGVTASIGF